MVEIRSTPIFRVAVAKGPLGGQIKPFTIDSACNCYESYAEIQTETLPAALDCGAARWCSGALTAAEHEAAGRLWVAW